MVSDKILQDIENSSVIRAMFIEGNERAEVIGRENVYDFSLGNPSVPAPKEVNAAIREVVDSEDSLTLHGYMDNIGYKEVRQAVAAHLNKRFETAFTQEHIVMTVGAAGAINVLIKTLFNQGDELITFAPFFSEYRNYASNYYGTVVTVRPNFETFEPDLIDFESKITPKTKAVMVNIPNNPSGVIYTEDTIRKIAQILEKKQEEYQTDIYIISDEPYRELVYDGAIVPFLTKYYRNTIVTYSFSKALSIPGERIGYMVIPGEISDFSLIKQGVAIANRILGFINAPSLMQKVIVKCLDAKVNVEYYDENRKLLYNSLTKLGFQCVKPQGAFYMFVKSPVENEKEFVEAAKKYNIFIVNGTSFACPGYVRIAYCVSKEMIERALPAFEQLAKEYFD